MITLSDLVALSRSYFKALALYNHDDITQQQGFDDIKHGDSKAINTLFAERIDTLMKSEEGCIYFIAKVNDMYLLVCLNRHMSDTAYVNGMICPDEQGNKFKKIDIIAGFKHDNYNKTITISNVIIEGISDMKVVIPYTSSSNVIIAIFDDDNRYSAWNKITRRLLISDIVDNNMHVAYCRKSFIIDNEMEEDITDLFPTDAFVYNSTGLNRAFYLYDNITFYAVLRNNDECIYTRLEKVTTDTGIQLIVGDGSARQAIDYVPDNSDLNEQGSITVHVNRNAGLSSTEYDMDILYVAIEKTDVDVAAYDIRRLLFNTNNGKAVVKNTYIGRVTSDLVKHIPAYRKFPMFDFECSKQQAQDQLDTSRNVTFYAIDANPSLMLIQADSTSQATMGYPADRSGLTLRYVNTEDKDSFILLPNDLCQSCHIDESRYNQYVCTLGEDDSDIENNDNENDDENNESDNDNSDDSDNNKEITCDYISSDKDGLVFTSDLVKALGLFNYRLNDSDDKCFIKENGTDSARIPASLLCNMSRYRYLLSECYKDKFSIKCDNNNKPEPIDSFTAVSINKDLITEGLTDLKHITFFSMFDTIKQSGCERWMLTFQLDLTNIDAVDSDHVYFDKDVGYGEERHVYMYIVKGKTPFIIFKHADIDGTDVCELDSISLIKLNEYDAIECKTKSGERLVVSASEHDGKLYVHRGGHMEDHLPINALADFDAKNENYNVYRCTIASFYADMTSKKQEAPARKTLGDNSKISIYIPNRDIRMNDHRTVVDLHSFCEEKMKEYNDLIDKSITTLNELGSGTFVKYDSSHTVNELYGLFNGKTNPPVESFYLFIGVEYDYTYKKSTSTYVIPHYFEKLIRYQVKQTAFGTDGTKYTIKDVDVENIIDYDSITNTYKQQKYNWKDDDNGVIILDNDSSAYTIDFGIVTLNTFEFFPIPGPLGMAKVEGNYNDLLDYIGNNGISLYQVLTNDSSNVAQTVIFPKDFDDIKYDGVNPESVTVKNAFVKCIAVVKTT